MFQRDFIGAIDKAIKKIAKENVMVNSESRLIAKVKELEENILEIELEKLDKMPEVEIHKDISCIRKALRLGIRDCFEKT